MSEVTNVQNRRNEGLVFIVAGFLVLLLHICRLCPWLFAGVITGEGLAAKILSGFIRQRVFDSILITKLFALALAVVYQVLCPKTGTIRSSWHSAIYRLFGGIVFYFAGIVLIDTGLGAERTVNDCLYVIVTVSGYLFSISGSGRLIMLMRGSAITDIFNREGSSFPQEQKLIETPFSIKLRAHYLWKGEIRKSWINFVNPRRGILIVGSPGAGKSWFIIENIIRQYIEKGFTMFIYDYKYDSLTRLAYNHFLKFKDQYPRNTSFYSINFDDLSRTHRCNCIEPGTLDSIVDAIDRSRTLLLSVNKIWVEREGDFWVESPMNFLAGIIWFLRKYEGGRYCTLPHAVELTHIPYEQLFMVLGTEPEVEVMVNPFKQALDNLNMELLDGQLASVKTPLARLASPDFYYILSGNDFSLDLNNPDSPKIFCLGGCAQKQKALAPVLSLFIEQTCKRMNRPGLYPSAVVFDEFSTIRSPSVITTISTGRSNNIAPVISCQDFSQIKMHYSLHESETLINMPGNIVCGQAHGATAKMVSDRFLKIRQRQVSRSSNSRDDSISESEHPETAISPATLSNLSSGEFVGIVADDPDRPMELKGFHAKIINDTARLNRERKEWVEMPVIREVNREQIDENYRRIKREVKDMVKAIVGRIDRDPEMMG
jgi:hypothetical protein